MLLPIILRLCYFYVESLKPYSEILLKDYDLLIKELKNTMSFILSISELCENSH